jgi:hypothetical protein
MTYIWAVRADAVTRIDDGNGNLAAEPLIGLGHPEDDPLRSSERNARL